MKTVGFSPKAVAAVVAAVLTYLVTQTVLELSSAVVVVIQAVLVALAAFAASPGQVAFDAEPVGDRTRRRQDGYTVIELAVGVLVFLILIVVALKLIDRV